MLRGWRTTEFWVSALTIVGTAAGVVAGVVTGPVGAVVGGVAAGAYALSRGIAKTKQGDIAGAAQEAQNVAKVVRDARKK